MPVSELMTEYILYNPNLYLFSIIHSTHSNMAFLFTTSLVTVQVTIINMSLNPNIHFLHLTHLWATFDMATPSFLKHSSLGLCVLSVMNKNDSSSSLQPYTTPNSAFSNGAFWVHRAYSLFSLNVSFQILGSLQVPHAN